MPTTHHCLLMPSAGASHKAFQFFMTLGHWKLAYLACIVTTKVVYKIREVLAFGAKFCNFVTSKVKGSSIFFQAADEAEMEESEDWKLAGNSNSTEIAASWEFPTWKNFFEIASLFDPFVKPDTIPTPTVFSGSHELFFYYILIFFCSMTKPNVCPSFSKQLNEVFIKNGKQSSLRETPKGFQTSSFTQLQ